MVMGWFEGAIAALVAGYSAGVQLSLAGIHAARSSSAEYTIIYN
jgi:hypothetical protein